MSTRTKKRNDPAPTRAPAPKRNRHSSSSESSSESSESELSELEEEMNTLITGATKGDNDDDDDDDESDDSSDEDTPEEREDSYVYEDDKDLSDTDVPPPKAPLKPPPRSSSRRKAAATTTTAAATAPRKSNLSNVSRPDDMKDTITVSGRRSGKARGAAAAAAAAAKQQPKQETIKLTLKMGRDKLREATSAWTPPPVATADGSAGTANATEESSSEEVPTRTGRGRKIVEEDSESDEDEDEDEDEDAEGEDEEDEDAEGEDDDGLNDEDAEGETDDEDMLDSDDEGTGVNSPDFRSRDGTPDMSRLTKRQKSRLDEVYSADLLELPTGIERPSAAKAIPLTADEQALKRAEMARRRKNLTDQRLEEEKMDTINKLLKKQTPKMRNKGRITGDATPAGGPQDTDLGGVAEAFPVPKMVRWVSNKDGIRLGVPDAWLSGPVGRVFEAQTETRGMRRARGLIEEIDEGTVPMEIGA